MIEVVIRAKDDAKGTIDRVQAALKGLEATGGPLSSTFGSIGSAIERLGPAGLIAAAGTTALAAAGVAATSAFVGAVREGANYADELNKVSKQTGLTTEEVSRLKFAADQNESSLAAVSSAIKFMSRNLYEAQQGGKEQVETLQALGFSGEEAAGHLGSTGEAILKVSDRLKAIPDQGTRTALAMKLLGRGAIEALPLLQQGGDAIRAYGDEADRAGITVSTLAGQLGDDFNDALGKVHSQFAGLKTDLAEAALPAFITVVNSMSEAVAKLGQTIEENKDSIKTLADFAGDVINIGINFAVTGVDLLKAGAEAIKPFLEFAKFARDPIKITLQGVNRQFQVGLDATQTPFLPDSEIDRGDRRFADVSTGRKNKAKELTDAEKAAIKQAKEEQEKFNTALERAYSISNVLAASLKDAFGVKPATGLITDFQKALDEAAKSSQKLRGLPTDERGDVLPAATIVTQDLNRELADGFDSRPLEEIKPTIDEAVASGSLLASAFESIGINVEALNERLAITGESINSLGILAESMGAAFDTAIGQAFNPLFVAMDGIGSAVGNLRGAFDDAFDSLGAAITNGTTGFLKLSTVIEGAFKALHRFVIELGLAIIKALILKAIGFGFLSGGGTIDSNAGGIPINVASRGGSVPGMSQGGSLNLRQAVAGLALGGAILSAPVHAASAFPVIRASTGATVSNVSNVLHSALFTSPVHAAAGVRIVPGAASALDQVPALLSPGEVVLPTVGGKSPSNMLGDLSQLNQNVRMVLARDEGGVSRGTQSPVIGQVIVHAFDGDSVRHQFRPGGEAERQIARSDELGRTPW